MKRFKYPVIEGCPEKYLKENVDKDGFYFRITKNNPPENADFIPHYISQERVHILMKKNYEKKNDYRHLCLMCGLSLFRNEREAILLMKRYPKLGRYLFKGYIKIEYGVLKASPNRERPSHHTWYPFEGVDEKDIFKLMIWEKVEKKDDI